MASLDIDLEPLAELHLAIGEVSGHIKELAEINRWRIPDFIDTNGSVVYNSSVSVNFIDLGAPMAGKWWNVRSIQIGGPDLTVTPTGVGWVIVQALPPTAQTPLVSIQDWTKANLPQNSFYGNRELRVRDNQHLYVQITGGANGQQYVASATVESYNQFARGSL